MAFDAAPQVSLEEMLAGQTPQMASYDESVLSYGAFKVCFLAAQSCGRFLSSLL